MPRGKSIKNESLLNAALEGLEIQRQRVEEQIREVRSMLGHGRVGRPSKRAEPAGGEKPARKKRVLSAAARKRIAAAQKARWAKFRKSTPAAGE